MSYQSFLIANYATGLDNELQPWLLPNDAFVDLLDGYVYRGVTNKRDGYKGFAIGLVNDYTESRIVHNITAEAYNTGNGTPGPYLHTAAEIPVSRGSITITAGAQTATDNGNGGFVTSPVGGSGTIDYTTGQMSITFANNVAGALAITVTYDFFPGLPVMGIMNFFPDNNIRQLIVADTRYVNKYDATTNRFVDISQPSPAVPYTGGNQDFWSWVNYASPTFAPRLLFSNGAAADVIQMWDGTTVTDYPAKMDSAVPPVTPFVVNARQIFEFQDRLILFQTYEAGVFFPRRIRISGFGANSDNFDISAPGAGFIDIPDNTFFFGAAFNRDDLLFFTESSTWLLKYTGNDVKPFILKKLDASRGSKAAFSAISYLNRTFAASPRGLLIVDGYSVERIDDNIPDFAYNNINNQEFESCFSGFIDEDRDVYMLYPSIGDVRPALVADSSSDRILVLNFEEDNYAIYRLPLSCMGNFQNNTGITWADLSAANGFPDWEALAVKYGNWNAFPYETGVPIALGGGHKGEVWELNASESEDNPQPIRNITLPVVGGDTIQVTTDWNNYELHDTIYFNGIGGMTEIEGQQGRITNIVTPYNVFDIEFTFPINNAWTSGGQASKVIELQATSKKLNPWVNADKKVRCGWIYFYVSTTDTFIKDRIDPTTTIPAKLLVDVFTNDFNNTTVPYKPNFTYEVDCSQTPGTQETKKWVKIWINQTAKFLQFRLRNNQAGARIKVHAMMPGFQPLGRLV